MKIATINQRCVYKKDGNQSFIHRAVFLCDKIESEKPDVIGFQEVIASSLKVFEKLLPEYIFVGQLRGANYDGEGLYVAIRKETCDLLGFETVWLSPTPYVPGSRFENQSDCPRTCLEVKVRHRASGMVFRLYDIHLDHISDEARVLGIKATFEFIDSFKKDGAPIVLLGDFNAFPNSKTIAICNAREDIREVTADIPYTFHCFGKYGGESDRPMEKIDYIYMSHELADKVTNVCAWEDKSYDIWLSDHFPVCAELDV